MFLVTERDIGTFPAVLVSTKACISSQNVIFSWPYPMFSVPNLTIPQAQHCHKVKLNLKKLKVSTYLWFARTYIVHHLFCWLNWWHQQVYIWYTMTKQLPHVENQQATKYLVLGLWESEKPLWSSFCILKERNKSKVLVSQLHTYIQTCKSANRSSPTFQYVWVFL